MAQNGNCHRTGNLGEGTGSEQNVCEAGEGNRGVKAMRKEWIAFIVLSQRSLLDILIIPVGFAYEDWVYNDM